MSDRFVVTLTPRIALALFILVSSCAVSLAQVDAAFPASQTRQNSCGNGPSGLVLYVPVDDDGERVAGLNIVDPSVDGIAGTIDTPPIEWLTALRANGKALASTDDKALLVDAVARTATELDVPADMGQLTEWTIGMPLGAGQTKTLLSDGRSLLLLDLASGELTDLQALLPADSPALPYAGSLSADNQWVIQWDGSRVWVLPTDAPGEIRPVTPEGIDSYGGTFSPDGRSLLYSREAEGDERSEIVVEPVDGATTPDVVARGTITSGVFVGGAERIAYQRITDQDGQFISRTVLFERSTGTETELLSQPIDPVTLIPSPSGDHLLVVTQSSDGATRYIDIDLTDGTILALPDITDHFLFGPHGSRWRIAMPMVEGSQDLASPGYYAVDLNTGTARIMSTIPFEAAVVVGQPLFTPDGEAAMGALFELDRRTLWAFNLSSALALPVRQSAFIGAAIAPNGCAFVVADLTESDAAPIVSIEQFGTEEPTAIGPGMLPIWVNE